MNTDQIEREIFINAPIERVWDAVTAPEFWVAEGSAEGFEFTAGARIVSRHAAYGDFPQLLLTVDRPSYIAYRWASGFPNHEPDTSNSTLVEMWLTSEGDQTKLRVVESGFDAIDAPIEQRRRAWEDNQGGWDQELAAFKERIERAVS